MNTKYLIYAPSEILVKIFSYFDDITILRGRCVCHRWHDILCGNYHVMFNIWNPIIEQRTVENYKELFLESCRQNSILSVNYFSKLIVQNITYLTYKPYDLWNLGLIIGAEINSPALIKLMIEFGSLHGQVDALLAAYKCNNTLAISTLMEEFNYAPHQHQQR